MDSHLLFHKNRYINKHIVDFSETLLQSEDVLMTIFDVLQQLLRLVSLHDYLDGENERNLSRTFHLQQGTSPLSPSLCLCLSLCLSFPLCLSVYPSVCVCLSVSFHLQQGTSTRSKIHQQRPYYYNSHEHCSEFKKASRKLLPLSLCLSFPLCLCVSVCLSMPLCVCWSLSLSLSMCVSISLSVSLSLSVSVFPSVSLRDWLSVSLYLCVCVGLSVYVCVYLPLCVSLCVCLSLCVSA